GRQQRFQAGIGGLRLRDRRDRRRRAPGRGQQPEWSDGKPAAGFAERRHRPRARDAAWNRADVETGRGRLRPRRLRAARSGGGCRARARMSDEFPVSARGLVKLYGELVAVDHVDLTVEKGDVFGYLGPNGAGKTTSLRMLLGLIRPTEGSIELFGRDPHVAGANALEGVAGFVEGPTFYPYLTARRNLRLLADLDGDG